jgi:hypothetical protein
VGLPERSPRLSRPGDAAIVNTSIGNRLLTEQEARNAVKDYLLRHSPHQIPAFGASWPCTGSIGPCCVQDAEWLVEANGRQYSIYRNGRVGSRESGRQREHLGPQGALGGNFKALIWILLTVLSLGAFYWLVWEPPPRSHCVPHETVTLDTVTKEVLDTGITFACTTVEGEASRLKKWLHQKERKRP